MQLDVHLLMPSKSIKPMHFAFLGHFSPEVEKRWGRGYEEINRAGTPALGESHPESPEMKDFCWGNCLGSLYRITTCNLGCWSPPLLTRSHFQMGAKVVS